MKDGSFLAGEMNVIHFKCINCGHIMPMDIDIAEEVLEVVKYKKERTYKAYCMKCNKPMYPTYVLDKNKK